MRTIVDLPEKQIEALKSLAESANVSRAELVRRAVADYLVRQQPPDGDSAFGLWKGRAQDGVAYQEQLRSEWDE
ncbi:MAG: CopG family transcriptional regulator [Gammaproteobacteria bacterium]|nr:CopG family transcriptional regulator [Gammaproteobacteria bacterium]